jgi:Zn-dependent M16 (insulinase) family peptidase
MLSELLLDGPNAPMYQALIEPQIGNVYAPGTGYEFHSKRSQQNKTKQNKMKRISKNVQLLFFWVFLLNSFL